MVGTGKRQKLVQEGGGKAGTAPPGAKGEGGSTLEVVDDGQLELAPP